MTPEILDAEIVDRDAQTPQGKPCAACGTPVEPLDKFCPACGTSNPNYAAAAASTRGQEKGASDDGHATLECQNCGAKIQTEPGQRSFTCPFCDSTYVVESPAQAGRDPPEFVIGFAITHEQAQEKFSAWLKGGSWFQPGDLFAQAVSDKLKGVYLPFWSFSMLAESDWQAQVGEHWQRTEHYTTRDDKGNLVTRTRQVTETEWWPLNGQHHRYYSGYLVSGSKGLSQNEALSIMPFQLPALRRYEPFFLAGWLAEDYSIGRDEALVQCQQEFYRQEQRNVGAFLPGDTHSGLVVNTRFSQVNSDLCLLPVYVLGYTYRGKLYRFLLNGQTGKTAGQKPTSAAKIALVVGLVLLIFLLIFMGALAANALGK